MAIRYDGHATGILFADRDGNILRTFNVETSPNNTGMEMIEWFGPNDRALLYSPPALYDSNGIKLINLPGLPAPSGGNQGWYHCIPVELDAGGRESVVLYDPYQDQVWIFGEEALAQTPPTGYTHTAHQYNVPLMD